MKFLKKYWLWFALIVGLIIVVVVPAILINVLPKSKSESNLYVYVKDNSIMIYNKKTGQKNNLGDAYIDEEYSNDQHLTYALSNDSKKLVFSDNISNGGYDLNYIDTRTLFKEGAISNLIDSEVNYSQITKEGVVYLKDNKLYYYDYKSKNEIADNVSDFWVMDSLEKVYYLNSDSNLYSINLEGNFDKIKIASGVENAVPFEDDIMYYKEQNDYFFELYIGDKKIDENIFKIINNFLDDGDLYYAKYEGEIKEINNPYEITSLKDAKESNGKVLVVLDNSSNNSYYSEHLYEELADLSEKYEFIYNYIYVDKLNEEQLKQLFMDIYAEQVANGNLTNEELEQLYEDITISATTFQTPNLLVLGDDKIIYGDDGYISNVYSILYSNDLIIHDNSYVLDFSKFFTYKYQNGIKEKVSDGIVTFPYNVKLEDLKYSLVTRYLNNIDYESAIINIDDMSSYEISIKTEDFLNLDAYNNLIYYKKDGKVYRANIEKEQLTNEKVIGEATCNYVFTFDKNYSYYEKSCDDFETTELYIYKDGVDTLLSDDISYIYEEYYTEGSEGMYDLFNISNNSKLIDTDVDSIYLIDNNLFYIKDKYTSSIDDKEYGDLYLFEDGKIITIDTDSLVDFIIRKVEVIQ